MSVKCSWYAGLQPRLCAQHFCMMTRPQRYGVKVNMSFDRRYNSGEVLPTHHPDAMLCDIGGPATLIGKDACAVPSDSCTTLD